MYFREIGKMVRALDEIAGKEVERIVEGGLNRQTLGVEHGESKACKAQRGRPSLSEHADYVRFYQKK